MFKFTHELAEPKEFSYEEKTRIIYDVLDLGGRIRHFGVGYIEFEASPKSKDFIALKEYIKSL